MFVVLALFLFGLFLVIKGGDMFVDASCWISDVTAISKVVIGATLVSFATTAPEYFVSLIATLKGANDLSIGNAVGSMTANIGIAYALLALCTPGIIDDKLFGKKGGIMLLATGLLLIFCISGAISIIEGLLLLVVFVFFTWMNIHYSKQDEYKAEKKPTNSKEIALNIGKFIGGAFAIIFGSKLLVDNGQIIAAVLGISEAVIGLTFIAIGTSLPELVTSIAAIVKKEGELSLGNILGANTLDGTLILATGAFVTKGNLTVSPETVRFDLPVSLLLMLIAVLPSAIGKKLYRWQGVLLIGLYGAYLVSIAVLRT